MKKQLLFLACMAVLFGCAKENLPQRPDATIAVGQAKSRFLTLDSIQQLAAELPECFGEGALTRSGYTKSVADLFPLNDILRSSATKSGETDDIFKLDDYETTTVHVSGLTVRWIIQLQ